MVFYRNKQVIREAQVGATAHGITNLEEMPVKDEYGVGGPPIIKVKGILVSGDAQGFAVGFGTYPNFCRLAIEGLEGVRSVGTKLGE